MIATAARILIHCLTAAAFAALLCNSSPAQEADPRLHADGKGWRLDKATVTDPKRPRVLLIGDSILNGYLAGVTKSLAGRAYVDAWVNPYCQSSYKLSEMIAEVLANGPYDVIHFNMGLHGWQKGRIPEGKFEPLMQQLVDALRANAPGAVLIWASSTPVTTKDKPGELDAEINPVIVEHNALAAKVVSANSVAINDLYALMLPKLDLARGDQFHWKPEGSQLQAQAVAEIVARKLDPNVRAESGKLPSK